MIAAYTNTDFFNANFMELIPWWHTNESSQQILEHENMLYLDVLVELRGYDAFNFDWSAAQAG